MTDPSVTTPCYPPVGSAFIPPSPRHHQQPQFPGDCVPPIVNLRHPPASTTTSCSSTSSGCGGVSSIRGLAAGGGVCYRPGGLQQQPAWHCAGSGSSGGSSSAASCSSCSSCGSGGAPLSHGNQTSGRRDCALELMVNWLANAGFAEYVVIRLT